MSSVLVIVRLTEFMWGVYLLKEEIQENNILHYAS